MTVNTTLITDDEIHGSNVSSLSTFLSTTVWKRPTSIPLFSRHRTVAGSSTVQVSSMVSIGTPNLGDGEGLLRQFLSWV